MWIGAVHRNGEASEVGRRLAEFRASWEPTGCGRGCGELHGCNTIPCGRPPRRPLDVGSDMSGSPLDDRNPDHEGRGAVLPTSATRPSFPGESAALTERSRHEGDCCRGLPRSVPPPYHCATPCGLVRTRFRKRGVRCPECLACAECLHRRSAGGADGVPGVGLDEPHRSALVTTGV
jgi:hypothetical protein